MEWRKEGEKKNKFCFFYAFFERAINKASRNRYLFAKTWRRVSGAWRRRGWRRGGGYGWMNGERVGLEKQAGAQGP